MASGAAKARAKLKYAPEQYTPWSLHQWPERQLRQEYTRLRDIAVKRLKRIRGEPGLSDADTDYWASQTPKLSTLVSRLEIEDALANLSVFITNPEISTVGGIRERREKQKKAWNDLTGGTEPPDIMTLGEWWAYVKSVGLADMYPSDEIIAYYYEVRGVRSRLTGDQFRRWLDRRAYWSDMAASGPEPDSGSDTF